MKHSQTHLTPLPPQALDCKKKVRIARNCLKYLDVVHYPTSAACIAALQEGGWTIWATDLDQVGEGDQQQQVKRGQEQQQQG